MGRAAARRKRARSVSKAIYRHASAAERRALAEQLANHSAIDRQIRNAVQTQMARVDRLAAASDRLLPELDPLVQRAIRAVEDLAALAPAIPVMLMACGHCGEVTTRCRCGLDWSRG